MRAIRTICTAAALAAASLVPVIAPIAPALAATAAAGPSRARVARATRDAMRSRYLWATVNICEHGDRPGGLVGVRGEMPALGFPARLSMGIQLRDYDTARQQWVDVSGRTADQTAALGIVRAGVRQGGVEFPYHSDTGALEARVTFTWTRDGRRLAETVRTTSGGHPSAAYGEPAHHSAASCRL